MKEGRRRHVGNEGRGEGVTSLPDERMKEKKKKGGREKSKNKEGRGGGEGETQGGSELMLREVDKGSRWIKMDKGSSKLLERE